MSNYAFRLTHTVHMYFVLKHLCDYPCVLITRIHIYTWGNTHYVRYLKLIRKITTN